MLYFFGLLAIMVMSSEKACNKNRCRIGYVCHSCLAYDVSDRDSVLRSMHLKLCPGHRTGERVMCELCASRFTSRNARRIKGTAAQVWNFNRDFNLMHRLGTAGGEQPGKVYSLWEAEVILGDPQVFGEEE